MLQIPGKDLSLILSNNSAGSTPMAVSVPSISQMREYPNVYDENNNNGKGCHEYSWIPTDIVDSEFM